MFCLTENACFLSNEKLLKSCELGQNRSKPWAIVHAFWPKRSPWEFQKVSSPKIFSLGMRTFLAGF
jgi:hypothetical protein